jgi:pyridoxal phosphate enzyme (YggS family)
MESLTEPMQISAETIRANLARIDARIAAAAARAGRVPGDVLLIPVTKTVGVRECRILQDLGYTHLGENRVELAAEKITVLGGGVTWHMIGHVQRRKAREVTQLFGRVDSVDRIELAESIEARSAALGKKMPVLLEVNVSGEDSKGGFMPEQVAQAVETVRAMPHLLLEGLMTMAPLVDDPEEVRPVFRGLRELAEKHGLKALSMGMSNDYEVAIEEGATEVRIGTAIFKAEGEESE